MGGHDEVRPAGDAGGFRVVVAGKGGVGKTTLTAVLARLLARRGFTVLAVDADPQMNLAHALGLPAAEAEALVPLSRNADYVEEKTGARPGGGWGQLLRLNPDLSDAVDRFGVAAPDGVRLLVMGTVLQPAVGCLCPENTLLAATVNALVLRPGEAILMDTQAGVEHFGRALARGFQQAIVVADPSANATATALQVARLARQLGIPAIHLVVNRVREPGELARVDARLAGQEGLFDTRHALPYDERVLEGDPAVSGLFEGAGSAFLEEARRLARAVVETEAEVAICAS